MNRRPVCRAAFILLLCVLFLAPAVPIQADDWYGEHGAYYQLLDDGGWPLTSLALTIYEGDEYITASNKRYRVKSVDNEALTAQAEFLGVLDLSQYVSALEAAPVNATNDPGVILMYCTHTDESYVPSDGTESKPEGGGILNVAQALKKAIEDKGGKVQLDETNHSPHDAGAYRRSRRTITKMMRDNGSPAAVLDVHRDAVPGKSYEADINGEKVTKVRVVIGGRNQNSDANKEFAYKLKAAADKSYPDLIKDIYIGKGNYNQELSPHSLLVECGTYENSRDQVEASMPMLADSICQAVYGGAPNQSGASAAPGQSPGASVSPGASASPGVAQQSVEKSSKGAGKGIIWMLVIVALVVIAYFLISMGSHERKEKLKGFFKREFGEFGPKKNK